MHDSLDLLPFVHGIVGLCFSRSAPAFADVLLQQVFQFADYFGMFLIDIFAFGGIVFHIIELNRWELGNGFLVHTRFGVAPTAGTGGTQQFPVSFTDGKLSADGVVHGCFTDGWHVVRIPDEGKNVVAVFRFVIFQGIMVEGGKRSVEVVEADSLRTGASTCTVDPFHDGGYAVTAVEEVGFHASPDVVGMMPLSCHFGDTSGGRATVVGGENYDGIGIYAVAPQGFAHLSHYIVHHQDEVAVITQSGFSFEGFGGQDGGMRGGQGQIEEEGAFVLRVTVDVVYCAVGQVGQTVLVVEVVAYGACTPEARFLSCGYGAYLGGGGLAVSMYT